MGTTVGTTTRPLLVEVEGITKRYGGITALDDVSVRFGAGSVRALCGGNGAGKSTLVKILAGVESADEGEVRVDGAPARIPSPSEATRLGFSFIHQELHLVPRFTALQNMAVGWSEGSRWGVLDRGAVRRRATEVMDRLGGGVPLDVEVARLTVSQRWTISLGRSLMRDARMIAMDEPTASFTEQEAEKLFAIVRDLTADGVAILYISHRLDEVLDIADDVTILRNGRVVGTYATADLDRDALARHIVGADGADLLAPGAAAVSPQAVAERPTILRARGLTREPRVRGVDLDLRRGEILGLAGLVGSGRTELARLLSGADRPSAGAMELDGRPYAPRSPFEAIARGVAMVPEERRSEGLLLGESITFNVTLATLDKGRVGRLPLIGAGRARRAAEEVVRRFGIKSRSVDQPVRDLSGGNQQKALVGRYVRSSPSILILDEPTVGVDVGARAELYAIVHELAAAGTTVVLICSDFEELAICDRVAVVRDGTVVRIVTGADTSKDRLTALCYAPTQEQT